MTAQTEDNINQGTLKTDPPPIPNTKHEVEKTVYKWNGPVRPFKQRDKDFWATLIAIASVFAVILFLVEGVMPVILIIALIFLFYVLSTVPPENAEFEITNFGLRIGDKLTPWEAITGFWFAKRFDQEMLILETTMIPGRVEIICDSQKKKEITEALSTYTIEKKPQITQVDRMTDWISRKLPNK